MYHGIAASLLEGCMKKENMSWDFFSQFCRCGGVDPTVAAQDGTVYSHCPRNVLNATASFTS